MSWIVDHFFAEAIDEGWMDAILLYVRNHPQAVRTMEYADHCDEVSSSRLPVPYPRYDEWRQRADSYVAARAD